MRRPGRRLLWVGAAMLSLSLLPACSHRSTDVATATPSTTPPPSTTTSTSTTTTVPPTTAPAPAPAPSPPPAPAGPPIKAGDRGPQVQALEQRLADLHFDPGPVDDTFDGNTTQAVIAFQKLAGLDRSGQAGPDVQQALATAQPPAPLMAAGGPTRVEIDLPRQVLMLYTGGNLAKILPVSTGSGKHYCEEGECGVAVTPPGSYQIFSKVEGWQKSPLGRLYNPVYFNKGIAIHGFPSVPTSPASHGCVRIPMGSAEWFPGQVPQGTPVYVSDGSTPLQPVNQAPPAPAPGAPPPPAPQP